MDRILLVWSYTTITLLALLFLTFVLATTWRTK